MSSKRISATQSKEARGMLKWSLYDIASHTSLTVEKLREFESGLLQMMQGDMDEVVQLYEHEGIAFLSNGKVNLSTSEQKEDDGGAFAMHVPPGFNVPAQEQKPAPPPLPKPKPKDPQTVTKMVGNTLVTQPVTKKKPPY